MRRGFPMKASGFTLMELIIVLVVVGVISAYAFMKNSSASVYTLLSQSQAIATDIRHVQSLATTWGRSLQINTTEGANGTYSVSCVITGTYPCNASPVINPATGSSFSVTLEKNAVLAGPSTLVIDSLGKPGAAESYTLSSGGNVVTISVAALTGYVTVSP